MSKVDTTYPKKRIKHELINDSFQNRSCYNIPKAQLVIADIPYNLANNMYASNPSWYEGGDSKNGESKLAGKQAFYSDNNFNLVEYMHFCNKLLIKEPKERGKAPAMIIFCAYQQMHMLTEVGKRYGFNHSYPLFFIKKSSAQALKANMRIVGATEHAVVLYRDKLPKFNNDWHLEEIGKKMILNWMPYDRDGKEVPKLHPTQKSVKVLERLIKTFTDEGDVVIDPTAGSFTTGYACWKLNRSCYGFEIHKPFYISAKKWMETWEHEPVQLSISL